MARRKQEPTTAEPSLRSLIISYLIAHGNEELRGKDLKRLHRFLRARRISSGSMERLGELVQAEVERLESPEREVEDLATLFKRDGTPRHESLRHGSPFCERCGMYKDYRKECGYCGKLELTI
jgi:hypothetical protein